MQVDRRAFVLGGVAGAVVGQPVIAAVADQRVTTALTPFALDYIAARNAPGMIVGVADTAGPQDAIRSRHGPSFAVPLVGAAERGAGDRLGGSDGRTDVRAGIALSLLQHGL